jgi:hypothetical protein
VSHASKSAEARRQDCPLRDGKGVYVEGPNIFKCSCGADIGDKCPICKGEGTYVEGPNIYRCLCKD